MKKLCIVFVLVLAIQNMFCLNKNDTAFFKTIKTPYGCSFNSKYGEIAYFVYRSPTDFELIYEGSGFITNLTDLIETETSIEIGFIDIWTGAEWTNKGDRRKIYKYYIPIKKSDIVANITAFFNIVPIFTASDTYDSVSKYYRYDKKCFFVKEDISVKKSANINSETILKITPQVPFEVIDICCSEKSKNDIWVKIKYEDCEGFVPLSALADDWTVKVNNLDYTAKEAAQAEKPCLPIRIVLLEPVAVRTGFNAADPCGVFDVPRDRLF